MKKVRFYFGIWCIPRFRGNFRPPAEKKAKTKRFYTPPLGRKKRQSLFPPKKNLLARAKQFMFEVGAKIDVWPFYVQTRSQNRSVTILNLYMGGGRGTHRNSPFPPSIDVWTDVSTDASTDASTPVSTDVGVYAHLLSFSLLGVFLCVILSARFYPKLRFPLVFSTTV